ncbi:MAG: DUF1444 family protein [Saprospiraceae bacterium]
MKDNLFSYEHSPVIAYGVDKGSHIEYSESTEQTDFDGKLSKIRELALANNAKIQVSHSVQDIEGDKLFIVEPHEYAAEKILDKAFLSVVAQELGTTSFLVGIPHQGVFAAMSSTSGFKLKFAGFIKQKFENPEANTITPHIFEIFEGEIISVGGEAIGSVTNTIGENANGDLTVEIKSDSLEEFREQVSAGYQQAMLLAMKNKQFSGNIIFNENNPNFKFDTAVLAKCKSFKDQIVDNEMAQTISIAMSGNGITPSFTHEGKMIALPATQQAEAQPTQPTQPTQNKKWWQFWK